MRSFCKFLREYTKNKFDFEKKMLPLTKETLKLHQDVYIKYGAFVEKELYKSSLKVKIIENLEVIAIKQVHIEVHRIIFVILNFICAMKSL